MKKIPLLFDLALLVAILNIIPLAMCFSNSFTNKGKFNDIIKKDPSQGYFKSTSGRVIAQCVVPIYYYIDNEVPKDSIVPIQNAFSFWNYYYNGELFVYRGITDLNVDDPTDYGFGIVTVSIDYWHNGNVLAYATLSKYLSYGCLLSTKISIYEDTLNLGYRNINNIMKHEIGHILGIKHNYLNGGLMSPTLNNMYDYDIYNDINEIEYRVFKVRY